jgi:DNA-binding response OmpR family regulator
VSDATHRPPDSGAPARILIADDEDGTLVLLASMLTYAGFAVTTARDGLEALVRAREAPPDLALLDVMMPGMDGREVCRRMGADPALSHVPVILHSSADERDIDWRGCGADAFLQKPFRIQEVPSLVRRHLAARVESGRAPVRRLSDDEIRDVALQVRAAVRRPPDLNPRDGVLSPYRELSPEDEARVEAALLALLLGE